MKSVKNGLFVVFASIILALSVGNARATLTVLDAWSTGDGLVVRDTATGLDWLALTVTNNYSINDILIGDLGNLLDVGFHYPPNRK